MFKKDFDSGFDRSGSAYRFRSGNLQASLMLSAIDYQELLQSQKNTPVVVLRDMWTTWWMFEGNFYAENEGYSADKVKLAVAEEERKLRMNLEIAFMNETKRALQIAQERPEHWERLLTVELLKAKLAPIRLRFSDIQKGTSHITPISVNWIEFISWIKLTIQSIQAVTQRLLGTMPELVSSLGSQGKAGDPIMIKQATDSIASCFNDLLRLFEDLHSRIPPVQLDSIKEQMNLLISNFLSNCISEFERLVEELNRGERKIKLKIALDELILQKISTAIPAIETELAEERRLEEKKLLEESERLFAAWNEKSNEKMVADVLNSLPLENIKVLVSAGNRIIENLYNEAKKEYDDWRLKGNAAVQRATEQFLKPGEDIKRLEEFIGKIPSDFIGGSDFESSFVYRKWLIRIEEAKRKLENVKKILRVKLGFPDITMEQEESALADSMREAIPGEVKMFVWNRDGGKCVKCGSREKLEFDHIIPLSMGGSNTARNIQLLCEKHNRSKGGSLV